MKDIWVKKYSFVWGLGYPYLIIEIRDDGSTNPDLYVHEVFINYETSSNQTYKYKPFQYELKRNGVSYNSKEAAQSLFDRHLPLITRKIVEQDGTAKNYLPLTVIQAGKESLNPLQFSGILKELKGKVKDSKFHGLLDNLDYLPITPVE